MGTIWQLCESGPATFRDLQSRCEGVSPTVLNARLKELRWANLVERTDAGYAATKLGEELYAMMKPMGSWSHKWARQIDK